MPVIPHNQTTPHHGGGRSSRVKSIRSMNASKAFDAIRDDINSRSESAEKALTKNIINKPGNTPYREGMTHLKKEDLKLSAWQKFLERDKRIMDHVDHHTVADKEKLAATPYEEGMVRMPKKIAEDMEHWNVGISPDNRKQARKVMADREKRSR